MITLLSAMALASCSSTDDGGPGATDRDAADQSRRDMPRSDQEDPSDPSPADARQDTPPQPDIPRGDGQLGEECTEDSRCASGVCWTTVVGSACTIECESMEECLDLGPLTCQEVRQGIRACATDLAVPAESCEDHTDCPHPYYCQEEYGWCALPECTWDADCPDGQVCQRLTRRCEPIVCQDTIECEHPLEICRGNDCQPPECTDSSQCDGLDYCHPNQFVCTTPLPCSGEEQLCVYNEECVGGYCYPNPCWAECEQAGEQCDRETGICGLTCTENGQCPPGQACRTGSGICYPNSEPFADSVAVIDSWRLKTANVPVGVPVQLSGEGSIDPEGEPLSYSWVVNAAPDQSGIEPGTSLGSSDATITIIPDVAGLYAIGLWVRDPGEITSMQDQVILWAR